MPVLNRENLALRLRQNWLAKHPVDLPNSSLDDSLTSLNWLQNLNIMNITSPTPPATPPLNPPTLIAQNSGDMRVNPNAILNVTNIPNVKHEPGLVRHVSRPGHFIDMTPHAIPTPAAMERIDYKTNIHVKPPYSYATLICMAMKESKKNKITLAGIYNWIIDNFIYYRHADPSWQNSIRHNLSLNKCFQKVARRKDEPGKGGFWRINPEYSDMFVNGIFKKRRSSTRENVAPPLKKIKKEDDTLSNSSWSDSDSSMDGSRQYSSDRSSMTHTQQGRDDLHSALKGPDFSWNAILSQDIDVGGVRIKTEDIIDESDSIASPITTLSPPPSESNSDIALEDFLNLDGEPLDFANGDPLDLTVQGAPIKAPEWWAESINSSLKGFLSPERHNNSGLNTPIAPSPVNAEEEEEFVHPWSENQDELDQAINSFDLDIRNLFNVPSPKFS